MKKATIVDTYYPTIVNGRIVRDIREMDIECLESPNQNLITLEGFPNFVDGYIDVSRNKITSLEGIGKDYLRQVNGLIYLYGNPIKSHMLGLIKVNGLLRINFTSGDLNRIEWNTTLIIEKIINKHFKDRDILECREELVQAGFKEYAKL